MNPVHQVCLECEPRSTIPNLSASSSCPVSLARFTVSRFNHLFDFPPLFRPPSPLQFHSNFTLPPPPSHDPPPLSAFSRFIFSIIYTCPFSFPFLALSFAFFFFLIPSLFLGFVFFPVNRDIFEYFEDCTGG